MAASYRYGVDWIALNDDPTIVEADVVAGMISTCLLADLFGKSPAQVAFDVIRRRKALSKEGS